VGEEEVGGRQEFEHPFSFNMAAKNLKMCLMCTKANYFGKSISWLVLEVVL